MTVVRAFTESSFRAATAVVLAIDGAVATITIGTGKRRNVLTPSDWDDLAHIAGDIARCAEVRVVVIRGGGRTFSAGSDLKLWEGDDRNVDQDFARMETALQAIEQIPIATIAVVEGIAAGAGCELALACDLRIFSRTARIGMPIVQLGVLVTPHFALRMTSVIGVARTRELLYTGRLIEAAEAELIGMANSVVSQAHVDEEIARWTSNISHQPQSGVAAVKAASSVALAELRSRHDAPDWASVDSEYLKKQVSAFFRR